MFLSLLITINTIINSHIIISPFLFISFCELRLLRKVNASQYSCLCVTVYTQYLAVEEPLQLQFSNSQLSIFLCQAPSCLSKVELGAADHTHIFLLLSQLHLVGLLQLEILKTPING